MWVRLRSALEEYAKGYRMKNEMSSKAYTAFDNRGIFSMNTIAADRFYYTKTTNMWAEWAKESKIIFKYAAEFLDQLYVATPHATEPYVVAPHATELSVGPTLCYSAKDATGATYLYVGRPGSADFEISTEDIAAIETGMASWVQEFERHVLNLRVLSPTYSNNFQALLSVQAGSPADLHASYTWATLHYNKYSDHGPKLVLLGIFHETILWFTSSSHRELPLSVGHVLDLCQRQKIEQSGLSLIAYFGRKNEIRTLRVPPPCYPHWGKIQWLEGGDMMHSSEIGKHGHGTRDATHVKTKQFNGQYGQLRLLVVVKLEPSEVLQTTTKKIHLLGVVARAVLTQKNRLNMPHTKGKYHTVEIIDTTDLEFVVGCVPDRGERIFIERIGCDNVLEAQLDSESTVVSRNYRQRNVRRE
ncbi:hypothetical protein C8R45DRAFT_937959 [Mycena sanguinolenta]|nr:hypothetical protein C8R45DRAFT_937959 [Mycena sanguinolenta]